MIQTITDPRSWQAETIDEAANWYLPLSEATLTALERLIRDRRDTPVVNLKASDSLRQTSAAETGRAKEALEKGRGFVVITPGQASRYSSEELLAMYWLVGQLLGQPFEQNVQGTLLYDVRDTGQDVRYGARFSVTNAESTYHTDNSFGAEILDYVGLLCLKPARAGGLSQLVSGYAVQEELMARHADGWEILRQPFHFDRRGGLRPGEEETVRFPILSGDRNDLIIRYLRYWIEVGHEKAGRPLTREQVNAMDVLDRVAGEERLRVEFMLRPGEMFFINNRWLLHNRTAFEDFSEPEQRRHYVRLWLRR